MPRRRHRKQNNGFRTVMSALLLVGILIGISYLFTVPELFSAENLKEPVANGLAMARDGISEAAAEVSAVLAEVVPAIGGVFLDAQPQGTPVPQPQSPTAVLVDERTLPPLLVNEANPLEEGYRPADLVLMRDYCPSAIVTIKGSEIEGVREAVDALLVMLQAAHADGITVWQVNAGYRSVKYQKTLMNNQIQANMDEGMSRSNATAAAKRQVAVPGASEHHTGLAFDITVPGESFRLTKQSKWLAEHCWEYGFIIRYTQEKEAITGIMAEPWHIRYVGTFHALAMRDAGLCLEEYIDQFE